MLKLIRSTKFEGVYCKDRRFHYVLKGQAPEECKEHVKRDLLTVSYCFFRGKWYQDVAYISQGSLKQIIDFADKSGVSIHNSYRSLLG